MIRYLMKQNHIELNGDLSFEPNDRKCSASYLQTILSCSKPTCYQFGLVKRLNSSRSLALICFDKCLAMDNIEIIDGNRKQYSDPFNAVNLFWLREMKPFACIFTLLSSPFVSECHVLNYNWIRFITPHLHAAPECEHKSREQERDSMMKKETFIQFISA